MRLFLIIFILVLKLPALADEPARGIFSYEIPVPDFKRSSVWWHPLGSFFVPGLAQFENEQFGAGLTYSIAAVSGIGVALNNWPEFTQEDRTLLKTDLTDREKLYVWGLQVYQAAGSVSAYHAFRSVAKQQQENGRFEFLKVDETPDQLMLAPFKFGYLTEPKTIIPLGLLTAGIIYFHNNGSPMNGSLTASEGVFTGGVSYNAGVGEEAIFRGYLMMNLRESWGSDFWSNAATATIFAAAHISEDNKYPWPQLLMGYYFGWMTQRNDWTLSENIFLHTWWDIIAISAALSEGSANKTIWIPLLSWTI